MFQMSGQPYHSPGHPSYKKQFVDPESTRATTSNEYAAHIKRQSKQRNADKRFNSPFAFHEPKYKRVSLMNRYPRAFVFVVTTVSLLTYFRLDKNFNLKIFDSNTDLTNTNFCVKFLLLASLYTMLL